jgi:hypothetical protein
MFSSYVRTPEEENKLKNFELLISSDVNLQYFTLTGNIFLSQTMSLLQAIRKHT